MPPPLEANALQPVPAVAGPLVTRPAPAEAPAPPAALSAPPNMEALGHALRRRWLTIVVLGLLGAGLGGAAAWHLVPGKYTAQVLLHLDSRVPGGNGNGEDFLSFVKTQAAALKSYSVLNQALKKVEVAELREVRDMADPVAYLQKNLITDSLLGPEVLRVTYGGDYADDVPVLLNEVARSYLRDFNDRANKKLAERIKQYRDNYRLGGERLNDKRAALHKKEKALGLDDPQTIQARHQAALGQLGATQTQRLNLQVTLRTTEVNLAAIREQIANPDTLSVSTLLFEEELKKDIAIAEHVKRLVVVEDHIQQLQRLATPGTADGDLKRYLKEKGDILKRIEQHRAKVRPAILAKIRQRKVEALQDESTKLERDLQLYKEQLRSVDGELKDLERRIAGYRAGRVTEKTTPEIEALRDEVAQLELVRKRVGEELGMLEAEYPVTPRVTLMEAATVPVSRTRTRQLKAASAAGIGMFGLVFLGIALVEFRLRRVYSSGDVAQGLGINLVGTVPAVHAGARRSLAAQEAPEQGAMIEAVDAIRSVLLRSARSDALQVIMVTSAVGGEGKTSLATHLAASLARGARKTLLVDADLRNPSAHRVFGMPVAPGLSEALRGEATADELIRPTSLDQLHLLSAGTCDRRAIAALAQDNLRTIFARLRQQYDFLIVDVCPLLPVADSLQIGQHADAVLLAVLRNVSRLPSIHAARQRLDALGIPMLGAVVIGEGVDAYGADRYRMKSGV